jgi:hypothetical protein
VALLRRVVSLYARIGSNYIHRAPSLLLLALVVFVPLGLIDAVTAEVNVDSLDLTSTVKVATAVGAAAALTMTSLLGEVFYSGVVAVSLTQGDEKRAPSPLRVARRLDYRSLILVDLAYVALVVVGLVLLVVPGILVFVWFGLAGPVVEIEKRSVRGALKRSFELVRGNFLTAFLILAPVEIAGDAVAELVTHEVHSLLGESFLATWLAESAANVVFTPVFALAAVLLTLELIGRAAPSPPRRSPAPAVANA